MTVGVSASPVVRVDDPVTGSTCMPRSCRAPSSTSGSWAARDAATISSQLATTSSGGTTSAGMISWRTATLISDEVRWDPSPAMRTSSPTRSMLSALPMAATSWVVLTDRLPT